MTAGGCTDGKSLMSREDTALGAAVQCGVQRSYRNVVYRQWAGSGHWLLPQAHPPSAAGTGHCAVLAM